MEVTRKKSCQQCRLAKTRCSLNAPHCARCSRRNLPCKYDRLGRNANKPPGDGSLFHSWSVAPNGTLQSPQACQNSPSKALPDSTGADSASSSTPGLLDFNRSPILGLEDDLSIGMGWNGNGANWPNNMDVLEAEEHSLECDQSRILDTVEQDFQDSTTWLEFISGNTARDAEESGDLLSKVSLVMNRSSNVFQTRWQALGDVRNGAPDLLSRSPNTKLSSLLIGNHLWATLESSAVGFCDGILPPFIHNSYRPEIAKGRGVVLADLPEPLANCRSIATMYLRKTPGNTALALKILSQEVQRLHDEFRKYDEWTLLYALQALTIYMIIAAADKDRCKLISIVVRIAVGEMAAEVSSQGYLSISEERGNIPQWQVWIQAESKRRTLIILHLIAKLLDLNVGLPPPAGCSHLDGVPLPSSKSLWEAETRAEWESEYRKHLSTRKGAGLLRTKWLRESPKSEMDGVRSDDLEDLSRWSEDVDQLGCMLLMALSGLDFS